MTSKNINDFLLTENVTVGNVRQWMAAKDSTSKDNLVKFISDRFNNRYIKHIRDIDSGFLKMAVSCLTIETLESFRQGRNNTKGVGQKMFDKFFEAEKENFPGFQDISADFYINIRCGILHQAETTNGWRILRRGALLDKKNKIINATKCVTALEKALESYIENLKANNFNTRLWINSLRKIESICENCNANS